MSLLRMLAVLVSVTALSACATLQKQLPDVLGLAPVARICLGLNGVPDNCVQVGGSAEVDPANAP